MCLARNAADPEDRNTFAAQAREQLAKAIGHAADYTNCYLSVLDKDNAQWVLLESHVRTYYIASMLCLVREAAYLFDQEFGGDSVLSLFDSAIGSLRRPPG